MIYMKPFEQKGRGVGGQGAGGTKTGEVGLDLGGGCASDLSKWANVGVSSLFVLWTVNAVKDLPFYAWAKKKC